MKVGMDALPELRGVNSEDILLQATYTGLKGTSLIGSFAGSLNVPSVARLVSEVQKGTNLSRTFNNPYGVTQNCSILPETALQAFEPVSELLWSKLDRDLPATGVKPISRDVSEPLRTYGAEFIPPRELYVAEVAGQCSRCECRQSGQLRERCATRSEQSLWGMGGLCIRSAEPAPYRISIQPTLWRSAAFRYAQSAAERHHWR
jgi:hypothetical protein